MIGIGILELLILLVVFGGIIIGGLALIARTRSGGATHSAPHPNLQSCPGCGAKISQVDDNCPQCGLRLAG
jgi:hypothetical protein